jgi:hypothetical protein
MTKKQRSLYQKLRQPRLIHIYQDNRHGKCTIQLFQIPAQNAYNKVYENKNKKFTACWKEKG